MVWITHDWDEEDYAATLEQAYEKYREACYQGKHLPVLQNREVRQAFLSGILWLNGRDDYCPDDLFAALNEILRGNLPEMAGDDDGN